MSNQKLKEITMAASQKSTALSYDGEKMLRLKEKMNKIQKHLSIVDDNKTPLSGINNESNSNVLKASESNQVSMPVNTGNINPKYIINAVTPTNMKTPLTKSSKLNAPFGSPLLSNISKISTEPDDSRIMPSHIDSLLIITPKMNESNPGNSPFKSINYQVNSPIPKKRHEMESPLSAIKYSINNENKENLIIESNPETLQIDFLLSSAPNKVKILKNILQKLEMYRLNPPNTTKLLQYFNTKYELSGKLYYNFSKETDNLKLKVLIQILYEELENLIIMQEGSTKTIQKQLDLYNEKNSKTDSIIRERDSINENLHTIEKTLNESEAKISKYKFFIKEVKKILSVVIEDIKHLEDIDKETSTPIKSKGSNDLSETYENLQNSTNGSITMDKTTSISSIINHNVDNKPIKLHANKPLNDSSTKRRKSISIKNQNSPNCTTSNKTTEGTSSNLANCLKVLNSLVNLLYSFEIIEDKTNNSLNMPINQEDNSIMDDLKNLSCSVYKGSPNNNNIMDWQIIVKKYENLITEIENKNSIIEKERSLTNKLRKMAEDQAGNKLLIEEIKKLKNEKVSLEKDFKKLQQTLHQAREDFNTLSNQFKILIFDKENQMNMLRIENETNKEKLEVVLNDLKNKDQINNQSILQMENQLAHTRERMIQLLNEKKLLDEENIESKKEKKELINQIYSLETKITEIKKENDMLNVTSSNLNANLKEKEEKIQNLTKENSEYHKTILKYELQEQAYKENVKSELERYEATIKDISFKVSELEDENKILKAQLQNTRFNKGNMDESEFERLINLIVSMADEGKNIDENTKSYLNQIFGTGLLLNIEELTCRISTLESEIQDIKNKYKENLANSMIKIDDIKWLYGLILKIQGIIERLGTTMVTKQFLHIYEEILQKKPIFEKKIIEMNKELEIDKKIIKDMSEPILSEQKQALCKFIKCLNSKPDQDFKSSNINNNSSSDIDNLKFSSREFKEFKESKLITENTILKKKLLMIQDELKTIKTPNEPNTTNKSINGNSGTKSLKKIPSINDEDQYVLMIHLQALSLEKFLNENYDEKC